MNVLLTGEHHAGQEDGLEGSERPVVAPEDGGQRDAQGLRVSAELVRCSSVNASGHLGQDDDKSCKQNLMFMISII